MSAVARKRAMRTIRLWAFIIFLHLAVFRLTAQNTVKVEGEYTYYAPLTESMAESEEKAVQQAKLEALREHFGSNVSEQTLMTVSGVSGTESSAMSFAECDVNGEWVADIDEPQVDFSRTASSVVWTVKVKGYARQIPHNRIDVDARLLFNGCDKEKNLLRHFTFISGDYFYLYFCAPVDGWLTVYLGDNDEEKTMQCILPYDGQSEGAYPIKGGKEYIFFSREHAEAEYAPLVTRMKMLSRTRRDFNVLYIIFSPNRFSKAADSANTDEEYMVRIGDEDVSILPRQTTASKFHKWLGKNRRRDIDMQVIKEPVMIEK